MIEVTRFYTLELSQRHDGKWHLWQYLPERDLHLNWNLGPICYVGRWIIVGVFHTEEGARRALEVRRRRLACLK